MMEREALEGYRKVAVSHQPSSHQQSAISHQPSAISSQLKTFSLTADG
jgi:hypothetical protein